MTIASYLNQTVTRKARSAYDAYGKATLGTGASIRGRFQASQKMLKDVKGNEFMVDAELWLKPTQDIFLDDIIEYESIAYQVVKIDIKRGLGGKVDHKKALLKRTKENG